jgi:transposase
VSVNRHHKVALTHIDDSVADHTVPSNRGVGVDPVWWTPLKLIFEVSNAPLPNRISAGVPAPDGRSGRTPEELAREFEPTAQSISTWVKQAEWDAGKRTDGLTSADREELARLRRENHRLRQERDILAKAAAWFARENKASPNGFTGS